MKILRIIPCALCAFLLMMSNAPLYALDWISLHETAEKIDPEQALENSRRNPDSLEDFYVLGLVYLNEHNSVKALDAFQRMLAIESTNREGRWGVAETMRRRHEYNEALPVLNELTEKYPEYAPAFITRGYISYIRGDWEEAVRQTGHVIKLGRKNVDTTNYLRAHGLYAAGRGMLAHYGGPFAKAVNGPAVLRHLNIIRNIAPESPIVTFGFGSYYMLVPSALGKNLDKAERYLNEAIKADPLFADPYVRLAQIYRARGDMEKYEQFINKALELDPGNELALDIRSGNCNFICLPD